MLKHHHFPTVLALLSGAQMRPIVQFYSKASSVLGDRSLHVFEAAGIGVSLVKNVVKAGGNVEIFFELAGEQRQVHDKEAPEFGLGERPSLTHVLRIEAGKELFLHEWKAEAGLGELLRRIGQKVPGHNVPRVLQGMRNGSFQAARPSGSQL